MITRNIRLYLVMILILAVSGKVLSQPETVLVDRCVERCGDDATYLKDFTVKLESSDAGGKLKVAKRSIILKKNTMYRFQVCDAETSNGEAVISLYDSDDQKKVASNYLKSSDKYYSSVDFKCTKTGVYHLLTSFKEGKAGRAVVILSFLKKF